MASIESTGQPFSFSLNNSFLCQTNAQTYNSYVGLSWNLMFESLVLWLEMINSLIYCSTFEYFVVYLTYNNIQSSKWYKLSEIICHDFSDITLTDDANVGIAMLDSVVMGYYDFIQRFSKAMDWPECEIKVSW